MPQQPCRISWCIGLRTDSKKYSGEFCTGHENDLLYITKGMKMWGPYLDEIVQAAKDLDVVGYINE